MDLLGDGTDVCDEITINSTFESSYNNTKRLQELSKNAVQDALARMRKEYKPSFDNDDESSEDEDEDGVLLTPDVESKLLETLAKIRRKDSDIYNSSVDFFKTTQENARLKIQNKPSLKVKDMVLDNIMLGDASKSRETQFRSYRSKQDDLKRAFKDVQTYQGDDDLFALKQAQCDDEILVDPNAEVFDGITGKSEDDSFLKDYIVNQWWKSGAAVPTVDDDPRFTIPDDEDDLDDDNEVIHQADLFEHVYNHRFEEPGSDKVLTYPRNVDETLRVAPSKRVEARNRRNAKTQLERVKLDEELRSLEKVKEQVLREKAAQVKRMAGADDLDISRVMMDDDFDPDSFNKEMEKMFGDDFYNDNDNAEHLVCAEEYGDSKPTLDPALIKEVAAAKKELNEVYDLDFEDILGDQKVKFKYKTVKAHDYGIPLQQVLAMPNKELSSMVSMKKLAPYTDDADDNLHWKAIQSKQRKIYRDYRKRTAEKAALDKTDRISSAPKAVAEVEHGKKKKRRGKRAKKNGSHY